MINKQGCIPLVEALEVFNRDNPISFHVPGHKNGRIFHEQGKSLFQHVLQIDATEVEGLDDLHAPEGAILQAEQLLSELYGTKKSYFLVNGTTCGNLAMILGNCSEGDTVLVQRNCHKSILNGLKLAKANPVFLRNELNKEWQVAEGISIDVVKKALEHYTDTKLLILTYPTYYGIANNIEEIITLAHRYNVTVVVDEAHGAHFIAGDPFPKSSLAYGADYVVHSAHKTLPALTMGSYLHVNNHVDDFRKVEMYLRMLQSSSPSYPIMASLDLARSFVATLTEKDLNYCLKTAQYFREKLSNIEGLKVLDHKDVQTDFLKVTLQTDGSFTGIQLQEELNHNGLYSELADQRNVLLILPLLKEQEEYPFDKAAKIIETAVTNLKRDNNPLKYIEIDEAIEDLLELEISFKEMETRNKIVVPLMKAINCIAAETIVPYPPGIPYIIDGEKVTERKLVYLQQMIDRGIRFHGGTFLNDQSILIYE